MDLNEKFEINSDTVGNLFVKMKEGQLIYDPYYQRKFVWDVQHQREFIRTILLGFPCPEIFVAEGEVDLETHIRYLHVIDGQQRLRTIELFLNNELAVDDKFYEDLDENTQLAVSTYKLGIVKLKYDPNQQTEEISEIFQRLNIGNFELSETEKTISKFSDNEFVLFARLISNDFVIDGDEEEETNTEIKRKFRENPFISNEFREWAESKNFAIFNSLFLNNEIYSMNQIKRNDNTKDVIDMIAILNNSRFHSRVL